jgi:hypothetical protein
MTITPARLLRPLAIAAAFAATAAPAAAAASAQAQQATSENWAGYVAGESSTGTGTQFSSVSASWVAPAVKCTTGQGYSAFWVGLGGAGQQSQSLEQVGTEADCSSDGAGDYFAWYELVPSAPVRLDLTVTPGDHVSGRVTVNGSQVTVSLSDQTSGAAMTKTLSMSDPDTSTAEWIAEAPSSCDQVGDCQPLPLADFGGVSFTNASATAGGHTGSISDSQWTSAQVALNGGAQQAPGFVVDQTSPSAQPSSLSSDGSAFSVAYSGVDPSSGVGAATSTAGGSGYSYGGSGYGGYGYGGYGYGGYGYGGSGAYGGYGYGSGGYGY